MPVVEYKIGDVLEQPVIVQQCNCVTVLSHGLSASIAQKYPWADIYKQRVPKSRNVAKSTSVPGTLTTSTNGTTTVIHLFAQWAPGKPGQWQWRYPGPADTPASRLNWFQQCLVQLDALQFPHVAVPHGIGCGLAGGDWVLYERLLNQATTPITLYTLQK